MDKVKKYGLFPVVRGLFLGVGLLCTLPIFAQNTPTPSPAGLQPIFLDSPQGLVYIEAEDAVSTNFTTQPTLDYGSSGQRMLQLNRTEPPSQGDGYFAEFVFLLDNPGTYRFAYNGTPPGPRDSLLPSYASPLRMYLNNELVGEYYREDVAVVQAHSSILYWVYVDDLVLDGGVNVLRLEVNQRRRYDNRFFLYLDSLFFLDVQAPYPDVASLAHPFPLDLDDRSIDNPYRSLREYESRIEANPEEIQNYLTIATVSSLLGDHECAIRFLLRGLLVRPDEPQLLVQLARNRIWRGDFREGMETFERYLRVNPQDAAVWAEAGKIAAWSAEYALSLGLYDRGLEVFPNDLNLQINRALTLLWANRSQEGLSSIQAIRRRNEQNIQDLLSIGSIFEVNGYENEAQATYELGIRLHPAVVQFYVELSNLHMNQGRSGDAQEVLETLSKVFLGDAQIERYIENLQERQNLRMGLIDQYREQLRLTPDDLDLRNALSQALFWNGMRSEAIAELENILVNRYFRRLSQLIEGQQDFLDLMNEAYSMVHSLGSFDQGTLNSQIQQIHRDLLRMIQAIQRNQTTLASAEQRIQTLEGDRRDREALRVQQLTGDIQEQTRSALELASELQELYRLIDEGVNTLAAQTARFDSLASSFRAFEGQQETWSNQLTQVRLQRGWNYNRTTFLQDLSKAAEGGNILGNTGKAILYLAAGELGPASLELDTRADTHIPLLDTLVNLTLIWNGSGVPVDSPGPDVPSSRPRLLLELEDPAAITEEFQLYRATLASLPSQFQELERKIQEQIQWGHRFLNTGVAFQSFLFEQDSFGLRNQLADYLVADGLYSPAVTQFTRVLVMDPRNIRATMQLATVQERLGQWSRAMETYKRVHELDRGQTVAVQRYNFLSRQHPLVTHGTFTTLVDPFRVITKGETGFSRDISSFFSLAAHYTIHHQRIHRSFASDPHPGLGTSQFHRLVMNPSWNLGNISFQPQAGVLVQNLLFEQEYSQIPAPFLVRDLGMTTAMYPVLGAGLRFTAAPVNIWGEYTFQPVLDSLQGTRTPAHSHALTFQLGAAWNFPQYPRLSSVSTRTYGSVDYRVSSNGSDENPLILTLVQDVLVGIHLADSPWTSMNVLFTTTYEDDVLQVNENGSFYVPRTVFTSKIGAQISSWMGLGPPGGAVLGLSGRIASGVYTRFQDTSETLPLVEGDLRAELVLGDVSFFVQGYGSGTVRVEGDFAGLPQYWAGQLSFGIRNSWARRIGD